MFYLDTSVVVPMFLPEPASEAILSWIESCEVPVMSSDWVIAEYSSAVSIKVRNKEISEKQARAARRAFSELCQGGLRLMPVSRSAYAAAAKLAGNAASGLRAGDSLHLAMAIEVGAIALATSDSSLARNAEANGMAVRRF